MFPAITQHDKERADMSKQKGKVTRQRKQSKLSKIDGRLLMFLPFFIAGVTYMRNDYHKKGQIVKMLPRDESFKK